MNTNCSACVLLGQNCPAHTERAHPRRPPLEGQEGLQILIDKDSVAIARDELPPMSLSLRTVQQPAERAIVSRTVESLLYRLIMINFQQRGFSFSHWRVCTTKVLSICSGKG